MANLPPKLQELAAGYVLGNLDPEELQEFQRLAADYPEQQQLVAEMQELMNQLPYSLTPQQPPAPARDRLLTSAAQETATFRTMRISKTSWIIAVLALGIGLLGSYTFNLRQELQLAQTELLKQQQELARVQSLNSQVANATLQIQTTPDVLMANWNGISQVLEDHLRAQTKGAKAVEIQAQTPPDLFEKLRAENFPLPQPTPSLSQKTLDFLGGSICQFEKTKGVRIMYETPTQQPISFYQLQRAATPNFPLALSEQLLIKNSVGPNLLIWGNETFLFAIVADVSMPELESLAATLEVPSPDTLRVF